MTLLATVVDTSRQVAATSARSAKTRLLAGCLRTLAADELETGVLYLSGEIRQGRIGIGPSALGACIGGAASAPSLQLLEVDCLAAQRARSRSSSRACSSASCGRERWRA
jgi:DNA ligase-1